MKEAGVSAGLKSNNFRIVDVARVPTAPIEPNIPRNLAFAFMLGLTSGVGLAFLLEGLDNTVRTTEQAQMISGFPPLGMIPLGSRTAREGANAKGLVLAASNSSNEAVELVTQNRPQSQMSESYRASAHLAAALSNLGAPPKVIMVTSALPQEGKSTTSISCANVLAQKGIRVLLIDADMRRPSIHKTLGMGPRSGLSNVLTGSTTWQQAITRCPALPNLEVLPAGTPPPNPAELLASTQMRDMLEEFARALRPHRGGHAPHSVGHGCGSAVAPGRCHRAGHPFRAYDQASPPPLPRYPYTSQREGLRSAPECSPLKLTQIIITITNTRVSIPGTIATTSRTTTIMMRVPTSKTRLRRRPLAHREQ